MKIFTITNIFAAIAVSATLSSSLATRNGGALKWTGPSNGKNITLFGNATEVIAQLKALDPHWVGVNSSVADISTDRGKLYCCPVAGQSFSVENVGDIQTAAANMANMGGYFSQEPTSCLEIASHGAATIVTCNDNSGWTTFEADAVASYAVSITTACPLDWLYRTCGQFFDTGGWNVITTGTGHYPSAGGD